jgi:hypothetical protein
MPLDAFADAYSLVVWKGLPVRSFVLPAAALREALPDFELRSFGVPPDDNPRMRCIVRMPTPDDPHERPVAAVSDRYDLLQHRVLASWLQANLTEAGLKDAEAEVTMTEYGERLRVTVPLADRTLDLAGDLLDPDRYRPEIEVTNSVDRSSAFNVVLRWRRLICLNGMWTMEQDRMRSVHRVDLSRTRLVRDFMAERLSRSPDVVQELRQWRRRKVTKAEAQRWCAGWLRDKGGWTVEACARMWAILETGYDGAVSPPSAGIKRHELSNYRVGQHRQVPGVSFPIETAYDVAQILTWITSNQRSVEWQTEGTEEVPRLMRQLLKG